MRLVLASSSARRAELMKMCGYDFEVLPARIDERIIEGMPEDMVRELSLQKAMHVYEELGADTVVVGSDTVVVSGGRILGKPADEAEAFDMLIGERGKTHIVYTGIAIVSSTVKSVDCDAAYVTFSYPLEDEIMSYIRTGDPLDKAGAYGIQGKFGMFVERIEGSFYTVMGLPIHLLYRMLKEVDVKPKWF